MQTSNDTDIPTDSRNHPEGKMKMHENFYNFIYTIIDTPIAPKPNLMHCPSLGLAGFNTDNFKNVDQ